MRSFALATARSILTIGKTVNTLDSAIGHRSTRANEFAQWALKCKLPELVQEQHAKLLPSIVAREFIFGYLLAESYLLQGNPALANTIAQQSLNQVPCNELGAPLTVAPDEAALGKPSIQLLGKGNPSDQDRRSTLAQKLEERGQFDWAEAEFRLVLNDDLTNMATLDGMTRLAAMLQIQSKHAEAADVLEPFVTRYNNEPLFQRQMNEWNRNIGNVLSNFHLYIADDARLQNDNDKAAKNYWQSIELSPENVDALIGLYKLPLSDSDKDKCRTKLAKIVFDLRAGIRNGEEELKKSKPNDLAFFSIWIADKSNTLAWLIANTEGSKEEALFLSRKACILSPEHAEYLDTLAYCYAAMDRYEDAVQQQRRAVDLKPHHPELVKALKRFEAKLRSAPRSP